MSIGLPANLPDIFSNTSVDIVHAMIVTAFVPISAGKATYGCQHGRQFTGTADPGTGPTVRIVAQYLLERPVELDLVLFGNNGAVKTIGNQFALLIRPASICIFPDNIMA